MSNSGIIKKTGKFIASHPAIIYKGIPLAIIAYTASPVIIPVATTVLYASPTIISTLSLAWSGYKMINSALNNPTVKMIKGVIY